jgi:hypothetical protein
MGYHDDPRDSRDDGRLSAEMSNQHEKGDASPRAEQYGSAHDMEVFEDEI